MMALNVISRPIGALVELNAIVKICNYRRLHEGHYIISMAVEVHSTLECDMDCFIKECACLFYDRQLRGQFILFFKIKYFRQHVSIVI